MSDTLAANQFATFDEYDAATIEHNRAGSRILNEIFGAQRGDDIADDVKARLWDAYAARVREWDADRPEWVR